MSLTQKAHQWVQTQPINAGRNHLRYAVDATCGNGNDTLFLARNTQHKVFSFDIQQSALSAAQQQLENSGLGSKVELCLNNHSEMQPFLQEKLPEQSPALRQIDAIMFNLGYLPKGDPAITTQPESTLAALDQSLELLSVGGVITVICYRGQNKGPQETQAVSNWFARQNKNELTYQLIDSEVPTSTSPILFAASRLG
ncbi:MAG: class I SAM-dependent methyltransferase [Arenicella sp.]